MSFSNQVPESRRDALKQVPKHQKHVIFRASMEVLTGSEVDRGPDVRCARALKPRIDVPEELTYSINRWLNDTRNESWTIASAGHR